MPTPSLHPPRSWPCQRIAAVTQSSSWSAATGLKVVPFFVHEIYSAGVAILPGSCLGGRFLYPALNFALPGEHGRRRDGALQASHSPSVNSFHVAAWLKTANCWISK